MDCLITGGRDSHDIQGKFIIKKCKLQPTTHKNPYTSSQPVNKNYIKNTTSSETLLFDLMHN